MPGHYYIDIPALYNAAMKISVYECFITHTHAHTRTRTRTCTHTHKHTHTHTHIPLISYLYVHSSVNALLECIKF